MRPRVRSYGLISTRTRSPSKIRIRNLRILPPVYARSSCPLSSLILNCVLGSASTTVPSISMASFLGTSRFYRARLERVLRGVGDRACLAVGAPGCRPTGAALGFETVGAVDGLVAAGLEGDAGFAVAGGALGHKHLAPGDGRRRVAAGRV